MIAIGGNEIGKVYVGSTEIDKIYLGSDLVYSSAPPVLPYDSKIEYIESVVGNKIVTDIYFDTTTEYICVFGFGNVSQRLLFTGIFGDDRDGYWAIRSTGYVERNYSNNSSVYAKNTTVTFVRSSGVKKANNTSIPYNSGADIGWFQKPNNPLCFFTYQYNKDGNCPNVKLYSAKVTKGGTVTNDLIPVRVGQVGYMYDKVSGTLYGNDGTGSFILGNDIT